MRPLSAVLAPAPAAAAAARVADAHAGAVLCVHLLEVAAAPAAVAVLASGGADCAVRLWRYAGARLAQVGELAGARGPVRACRVDPSGALVAGADATGGVLLWRVEAGGEGAAARGNSGLEAG